MQQFKKLVITKNKIEITLAWGVLNFIHGAILEVAVKPKTIKFKRTHIDLTGSIVRLFRKKMQNFTLGSSQKRGTPQNLGCSQIPKNEGPPERTKREGSRQKPNRAPRPSKQNLSNPPDFWVGQKTFQKFIQKSHLPTLHYEIQSQKIKWFWKFYLFSRHYYKLTFSSFLLELSKVKITSFKKHSGKL